MNTLRRRLDRLQPLHTHGRMFNSFLMLFGVGTMFFAIGAVTQSIIEVQFGGDVFQKRRVRKMIEKLKDHYIVCGYGSADKVERAIKTGLPAVVADSTQDETLREAGVERARGLIAALTTDADNLFLILSAKSMNPGLKVVARVAAEASECEVRA